jgi:hypothetical protein
MKAYEDHNILKKAAYEKAKKDLAAKPQLNDGGKSLFQAGVPKSGRSLGGSKTKAA